MISGMKKILMVITSHSAMENTDSKTGVLLGEFTDPYYEFIDAGYTVTLTSPKGGRPPVDWVSELTENITESNRRFQEDEIAKAAFSHTSVLNLINPADYDAVFYPGGHGPIWDLAVDNNSGLLILDFLDTGTCCCRMPWPSCADQCRKIKTWSIGWQNHLRI